MTVIYLDMKESNELQIQFLIDEHNVINSLFLILEQNIENEHEWQCLKILNALEKKLIAHYNKEELNLFERAFQKNKLTEGGPFCTLYFDVFMNNRPLTQLAQILKKLKPTFQKINANSNTEKYFSSGSPLSIPCEEHLAILTLTSELKLLLEINQSLDWVQIKSAIQLLKKWLQNNHEKEEKCLFPLLINIL